MYLVVLSGRIVGSILERLYSISLQGDCIYIYVDIHIYALTTDE